MDNPSNPPILYKTLIRYRQVDRVSDPVLSTGTLQYTRAGLVSTMVVLCLGTGIFTMMQAMLGNALPLIAQRYGANNQLIALLSSTIPYIFNMIITPICAHSLHAKPFVLGSERSVGVRLAPGSRKNASLSVDGGRAFKVQPGDWVECRKSRHVTRLVKLTGRTFYEVINQKLGKA